jgi:hypothetical protein
VTADARRSRGVPDPGRAGFASEVASVDGGIGMHPWLEHPTVYEINAWTWLHALGRNGESISNESISNQRQASAF